VFILSLSCPQGDADRPRPRAHQGAQVGDTCDDEAVFVEGTMGSGKRGGDG
jgi:hypothetical protein